MKVLKFVLGAFFACLILSYNFGLWNNDDNHDQNGILPVVENDSTNLFIKDNNGNDGKTFLRKEVKLPVPRSVQEISISSSDFERKTRKTPYTYKYDVKTRIPRLTKEEIAAAPIVDIVKMRMNGEDMEMVVVEKDGKTYDASDGVIVYFPKKYGKLFQQYK